MTGTLPRALTRSSPFLLCLLIVGVAQAQTPPAGADSTPSPHAGPPHAPARRLAAAPKIDGTIDPEEWREAFHTDELRDRITTQPPADRTEVWAGYNEKNLYFAFRCHDAQPGKIVAREVTPNSSLDGDDNVTVAINALGNRTFDRSFFTVNALGTKNESLVGGRAEKREWRGDWQAAARRDAGGWSAEIAIPWSMLNYPRREKMAMGVNFFRNQIRTRISSSWANVSQNPQPENDGYWDEVEPPAPPSPRPQFLAYAAPEFDSGHVGVRTGLDARYPITPTLYSLASLAPDFRNIENDVAGVSFTRVERYVGDARPFFNEGNDYFSLNRNYTFGDLLYSRRIGEFDFGGKVYGQLTPTTTLGAFAAVNLQGQRAAVLNYGRTFSSTSSANVYATYDQDGPNSVGRQNAAFGGSAAKRFGNLTLAGSLSGEGDGSLGGDLAGALVMDYGAPQIFTTIKYLTVAPDFDPSLGYIPWRDRRGYNSYTEASREFRRGPIRGIFGNLDISRFKTFEGDIQQSGYSAFFNVQSRSDLELSLSHERYTYFGALDEVTGVGFGYNVSNRFRQFGIYREDGVRNDRSSHFTSFNGTYRIGNRFDLGLSQSVQEDDGSARLSILTAGYQLSPTRAITGRAVIRDGKSNLYAAYRSAGGRGTDVFFIVGDPNAATTVPRLSLKLVRAF